MTTQLRWIFGLTALATIALVGLQAYIWKQGLREERERFSRSLHHAVFEAAEEFTRPWAIKMITSEDDSVALRQPGFIALQIGRVDTNVTVRISPRAGDSVREHVVSVDRIRTIDSLHVIGDTLGAVWQFDVGDSVSNRFFFRQRQRCPSCEAGYSRLSTENFKPLLNRELARMDVDTTYEWGVRHLGEWLIADGDTARLLASNWQIPFFMFPGSFQQDMEVRDFHEASLNLSSLTAPMLVLDFPNERWQLVRNIGPTLLSSTLLSLLVLGCIGYGLYVILQQKQLSEIKTDFINNMTHELKTPISTIALACEAMQDPGVDIPVTTRQHYLQMISAESGRLAAQVEKVLQMAQLDKKDLDLKNEPVDVHLVLQEAIQAFSLQMEQRKGAITAALNASANTVEGDLMHLRQVFMNLLDNANKYSPNAPDIRVETKDTHSGIEIAFHDKGMGISREALRKIFDRFYRVPTGNLHDVKGFGLGLSYVQTMVQAHGGRVYARSRPGAGSSFYLFLPYTHG